MEKQTSNEGTAPKLSKTERIAAKKAKRAEKEALAALENHGKKAGKTDKSGKTDKTAKKKDRQDAKNSGAAAKKVTEREDVLYNYEKGMDAGAKKKFRAEARRKRNSMLEKISKVRKGKVEGNLKELIKGYNAWATEVFRQPVLQELPKKKDKTEKAAA